MDVPDLTGYRLRDRSSEWLHKIKTTSASDFPAALVGIEAFHVQLRRPETGPSWEGVLRPEPLNYVTFFNPSWHGRRGKACVIRLRSRFHDAGTTLNDVLGLGPARGCPLFQNVEVFDC